MLRLSRKVEYAVLALLDMERNGNGKWLSAKEIARRNRIPAELLGRILSRLAHAGMVDSVQGVRGGFRLSRMLDDIALSDVVETVDGPVRLTCCQENPKACGQFAACGIREPVLKVQRDLIRFMQNLSVASFRNGKGGVRKRANVSR